MDESSTTIALTTRLRKRSISSHHHHHSRVENNGRTSLIKTKIQKIDGQYKASPTCPINNEVHQENSSDDQDEPLIVATLPPLVQNSSKYRTRQDIYDDEAGDDQQSNSSSVEDSPKHQSESSLSAQSPIKSTIITIQKPIQTLNDNRNETINGTSIDILTMPGRRSNRSLSEENIQEKSIIIEESVQQRTKLTKRSNVMKSSISSCSSAISLEQNPTIDSTNQTSSSPLPPPSTIDETYSTTDDIPNKPTTSVDVSTSNNKPSQNTNDQSKVKVRLKTIPLSSQTNKNTKPVINTKTTKSVEQKPIKKPSTIQKETVTTTKKPTPTVTPKKPVNTSINKPLLNHNNSEKQPVRPSSITPSSKPTEKKSSDISNSTTTTPKKPTEPTPTKKPPVTLGKIPKLNSANKQALTEKPTSSKSLTDHKLDLLASSGNPNNNKEVNTTEKNPSKLQRRSPQRSNRPQQNPIDSSDPFMPLSPIDLDTTTDKTLGKQSSISNQRYPSLLDNNPRSTSNFSRTNSIGLENTQSQSPLSPGPLSTLYPPPSPPLLQLAVSRSIPPSTKTFSDSRSNQSLVRPSSSLNLINTQSIPSSSLASNDHQDPWTTNKPTNIWDSASSDEEQEDDSSARRFFHQNMRAVDEELSKIDELCTSTPPPPPPTDSRIEHLLKRQKKASLGLASNVGTYEENTIEPSASVDDFECVAMDIDSPKHRTQSESSDNNHTIVESNNSKSTTNGTAFSKVAELPTASSTDTSKKLTSKNRPLKTASMTLIDELKNSINPSFSSKQSVLSPPSRSLSRSRSRTRSRTRSRSHTRSRSRSRSSSSSSSSSSHKRRSRSRHRSSKRRSNKHHQRRRSVSYNDDNELTENNNNNNNYPSASIYYQSHHHPHHQPHWPSVRQPSGLLPGPPTQPFGHQPPVPPLLPNHSYYPPSNRALMHPVDSPGGSRFNFQHNPHQRHHPPLMHPSYYPPVPPQPLMQSASHSHHHPMNRYPPPPRPFEIPPHPMAMGNTGPHPPNPNYNQFKYESDEHVAARRAKRDTPMVGTNTNNNRRGGPQQTESNGKKKMNNPSKSNTKSSDHSDMDQLCLKRDQLKAELDEITNSGDIDNGQSSASHNKRSISSNHSNQTKLSISQDDEGEEGEISESD